MMILFAAFAGDGFGQTWEIISQAGQVNQGVNSNDGYVSCDATGGKIAITSNLLFNGSPYQPSQGYPTGNTYKTQKVWAIGVNAGGQIFALHGSGTSIYQYKITDFEYGSSLYFYVPNYIKSVYICMSPSNYSYNSGQANTPIAGHGGLNYTFKINVWNQASNFANSSIASTTCPGNPVSLTSSYNVAGYTGTAVPHFNTIVPNPNKVNIKWYKGSTVVANSQNATVNPLVTTTYIPKFDVNGQCNVSGSPVTATVNPAPVVTATITQPKCFGEGATIDLSVSGGTAPYTYKWYLGTYLLTSVTGPNLPPVNPGTYNVEVISATGCSTKLNGMITTAPLATAAISVGSLSRTNATCKGISNGTMTFNGITGGVPPYIITSTAGSSSGPITGPNYTIQNMVGNQNHSFIITDAEGCEYTGSMNILNNAPTIAAATSILTNETCDGQSNGEIAYTGSGHTYHWSTGSNSSTISNLSPGNYLVTTTDPNGCEANNSHTIVTDPTTWHKTTNNTSSNEDKTIKVLSDPSNGDVYVLGEFKGTTEVDGTSISAGNSSKPGVFIVKYDECGTEQWIVHSSALNISDFTGVDLQFNGSKIRVYVQFPNPGSNSFTMVSSKPATKLVTLNSNTENVFSIDITKTDGDLPNAASLYTLASTDIVNQVIYDAVNDDSYFAGQFDIGGSVNAAVMKFTGTSMMAPPILDNNPNNIITAMVLDDTRIYATANLTNIANFGLGNIYVNGTQEAVILLSDGTTMVNMQAANATNFVSANDLVLESNGSLWMAIQVNGSLPNWSTWSTSFNNAMVVNLNPNFGIIESSFVKESNSSLHESSAERLSIKNNNLYVAGTFFGGSITIGNNNVGFTNPSNVMGNGSSTDLWMAKYQLGLNTFSWIQGSYNAEDVSVTDISYDGNFAFITGAYKADFDFQGMQTGLIHPNAGGTNLGFIIRGSDLATSGTTGQYYKTDQSNTNPETSAAVLENSNALSVFPNPSNGTFKLSLSSSTEGPVHLFVYDLAGKLVYSDVIQKSSTVFEHSIVLAQFESGMYLLKVKIQNQTEYQKLLIK